MFFSESIRQGVTDPLNNKVVAGNSTLEKNEPTPTETEESVELVKYDGVVRHLFYHCLIAFPKMSGSSSLATDCVTVSEFKNSINELYENDYILVDINDVYEIIDENGTKVARQKILEIPKGKKPIILSVDDVVYDSKKHGKGMVDKLVLNSEGNLETETIMDDGSKVRSEDNEIFPILDKFVEEHPDFSKDGAKGTLALTGWEGILGYRISSSYPQNTRENELKDLKPVVEKLKESGWNFASHSYGHYSPSKISDDYFINNDIKKWEDEIGSVVGDTSVYIYPYGEIIQQNSIKYKALQEHGFYVFCGVCQNQEWFNFGNTLYMSRYSIDGTTLSTQHDKLVDLFDTNKVYDEETRNLLN
jgi:peptidoglycan/xylan/chitin deacetylase (PgdA/CDA1 family)